MRLLFLRGQVPSDRPASQITFNTLSENDDMWLQLANRLVTKTNGYGELWYEKGNRVVDYSDAFKERWVDRYAKTKCLFTPDVVFARGGFDFMTVEAARHKSAVKIYYGAGARAVPPAGGPWDLVFVDTLKQLMAAQNNGYCASLFVKPAADNVFMPMPAEKRYDVIFVANYSKHAYKGHTFVLDALKGVPFIHVGISRSKWAKTCPTGTFTGWVPRKELPLLYAQAKVAVIHTRGQDSCPRVVPEALACGCPILVSNSTRLNFDLYCPKNVGRVFDETTFSDDLDWALRNYNKLSPRNHYTNHLSIDRAVDNILNCLRQVPNG